MNENYLEFDMTGALWREYVMNDGFGGQIIYRIDNPVKMIIRKGGVSQRIIDDKGIVHLCPGIGYRGAVTRWQPRDPNNPVRF